MKLPGGLDIRPFDPHTASDADLAALYALDSVLEVEGRPQVPAVSQDAFTKSQRRIWPGTKSHHWLAWQGSSVAGWGPLDLSTTEVNAYSAGFWIGVRRDSRRQGLGRELLRLIAGTARQADQDELGTWSSSHVPAASAFMERIGAHVHVEHQDSALDLDTLDHVLVKQWLSRGVSLSNQYELVTNTGPWPDAGIDDICRMYEIMNTAPHQADFDPEPRTPEHIRLQEAFQASAGIERWTMYLRPISSSTIAAYTEVYWRPDVPALLSQGDTAVAPEHRGKGLAIWLKAAMLAKVLKDRPEVRRITTGNATTNAPMLSINQRLGFKPTHSAYMWQVPLGRIMEYLASKS
jgi:GNAT superfamily N-acetyltransferase